MDDYELSDVTVATLNSNITLFKKTSRKRRAMSSKDKFNLKSKKIIDQGVIGKDRES